MLCHVGQKAGQSANRYNIASDSDSRGKSPSRNPYAPVAQWIEHRPSKPRVAGSSPAGRANFAHARSFHPVVGFGPPLLRSGRAGTPRSKAAKRGNLRLKAS